MSIYPPSEDTFLLLDNMRCGEHVLEMGTGNGIIAVECAKRGSRVLAVDISDEALENLRRLRDEENLNIEILKSDLFENITGKFDTIIFNPPYLPGDATEMDDLQWAGGGEHGDEIVFQFLEDAWGYLKENGEIYVVLSSFNRIEELKKLPYAFEKLAEMKLAFHSICVFRLTRA